MKFYILASFLACFGGTTEIKSQVLSLSFNLSETDTLANMIANSKKYDISSLTISGYVNSANTLYIIDLNNKGNLRNLDISKVSHIDYYTKREYKYSYQWGGNLSKVKIDLTKELWPQTADLSTLLSENAPGHLGRLDMDELIIEDEYKNTHIIRSFSFFYHDYRTDLRYDVKVNYNIPYSLNNPKIAFRGCAFNTFTIPDSLLYIGGDELTYSVSDCSKYIIGSKVKNIYENAFKDSHINDIVLNSVIDSIKANAFEGATGNVLSNTTFLENVKYIGKGAFKKSKLIDIRDNVLVLKANIIEDCAFLEAKLPNIISLNNIEELGDSTFMYTNIVNIDMGNEIKDIGSSTFAFCEALQTINGGLNVEQIGKRAFYGCYQLNAFTPSNNLRVIGQEAFAYTGLVSFSIPNNTISIGYKAFAESGLKEFGLGNYGDFRRDIIDGCGSLEIISASSDNTKLKSANGVLLSKDESKILAYPCAKEDAMYEINNRVKEIADSAFYSVNKLKELSISETVTKIGKNAFGNNNILEVKILSTVPPNVTDNLSGLDQSLVRLFVHEKDFSTYYIANYWGDFKNIFVLEKAVSPDNLINVEMAGTLPEYIGFGNQLKYNSLRLSGYLNSNDILYLREMAGRDVRGKKTSGILTDLDFSQASIVKGGSSYYIKSEYSSGKLTTSDNIIGESMFEGCNFTSLKISESTTKIVDKAFYGCKLESFKLPAVTMELNPNSFFGMFTLKEIIVDSNNPYYVSLDGVLFTKDGKSLLIYPYAKLGERYSTPETTTSIGEQAFGGYYLKTININEGLKEIGTMAFYNLGSLEGISLPSSLETIGHRAFWRCNNLLNITCKAYYPPTLKYDSNSYYGQPYNNFSDKTYKNAVLIVPEKNGGYKSRSGWKLFNNVIESDDWMSGIKTISDFDNTEIVKRYNLNGRATMNSYHGVSIIKMNNGSTKKVILK